MNYILTEDHLGATWMSSLYFAFGSNLDATQMKERCPGYQDVGRAVLENFALSFPVESKTTWKCGVASVSPVQRQNVYGFLYRLNPEDWHRLDAKEGVARSVYKRLSISVTNLETQTVDAAETYVAVSPGNAPLPSATYMAQIIRGAKARMLPKPWIQKLESIPKKEGGAV